ncbi:MAG: adenylosuccinate lyase, partial [Gemmatimonadota bacterium]
FLLVEHLLIAGVREGGDRQELHERIRRHAMAARERMEEEATENDFLERVEADPELPLGAERLRELADPTHLTGRAEEQVDRFLEGRVDPVLEAAGAEAPTSTLRV